MRCTTSSFRLPVRPPRLESGVSRPDRRRCARPAALTAVLTVSAALIVGCSAPVGEADPPTAALPDGVSVQLVQLRSDVAARQAQVQVHNSTDADLTIGSLSVSDPRFTEPAARVLDRESRVPAGGTVDIRIQLPPMDCSAPADDESSVQFVSSAEDGQVRVEAPIDDPIGFLQRLYERECRAQTVADAAALSLASFAPSPAEEPADLVLEIAPTGEDAVRIVGIQTTNLLTFDMTAGSTAGTFPIDVAVGVGDTRATSVHLPLVPFRCDPHAVQEDKRGTIFTIEVELDGVPGEIELAASEDMRGSILTWVANWCGYGSG